MTNQDIWELKRVFGDTDGRDIISKRLSNNFLCNQFKDPYNEVVIGVLKADTFEFVEDYKITPKRKVKGDNYNIILTIQLKDGKTERMTDKNPVYGVFAPTKYLVYKKP